MLPEQHAKFVREYLIDRDGTRAYKEAYPKCNSDKAAYVGSRRLLKNDAIATALETAQLRAAAPSELTAAWVLARLKEESEFCGQGSSHGARVKALECLGKHFAMFTERIQIEERKRLEVVIEVVTHVDPVEVASEATRLLPIPGLIPGFVRGPGIGQESSPDV